MVMEFQNKAVFLDAKLKKDLPGKTAGKINKYIEHIIQSFL